MKKFIACLLLALMSGCAGFIEGSRQTVVVGVHSLAAVADVLGPVDQAKIDAAVAKAKAGDVAGGQADLDRWDAQFTKIQLGLSLAWDSLRALADGVTAVEQGKADKSTLPKLMSALLTALSNLSKSLAEAGIHVPGLGA